VVGNRNKFNNEGVVAVNYTEADKFIGEFEMENIRLIRALAVLSALFHDLGKSSTAFQNKLKDNKKSDAIRHEWVSILILAKFISNKNDEEWLQNLIDGDLEDKFDLDYQDIKEPLKNFPDSAKMIAWLVFTHHLLPINDKNYKRSDSFNFKEIMNLFDKEWGYFNKDQKLLIRECFDFKELPSKSQKWQTQVKKWSRKLKECLPDLEKSLADGSYRLVLNYARTCLMLGDHYFSSQAKDHTHKSEMTLYANTDKNGLKQFLDEHILGVAKQTQKNVDKLLYFENIPPVFDSLQLKKSSPKGYEWQDKAVKSIKNWRIEQKIDNNQFGFFAVNMASTGKGKTFANAKIMRMLSPKMDSLRYILALGLRTLTLQTGNEYQNKIGLKDDELAVLIGSKAINDLHYKDKVSELKNNSTGSESEQELYNDEIIFNGVLSQGLDTVLKNKKSKQLLYAPVLSCTIDHIIGATETKRGGKYILPFLRLMSSDLVIDEVDDFDGKDLIAIGRLIHHAGMLGRKVMISSATIPPDLALGFFNAYKEGWQIFAKMRGKTQEIGCLWVDEFNSSTKIEKNYQEQHANFIKKRIQKLKQEKPKRKANIVQCSADIKEYFNAIAEEILIKHKDNNFKDTQGNTISIGVVRMANIKPTIALTKHLLICNFPEGFEIRTMAYHSAQVLLMRHEQEKYLDSILKNRDKNNTILKEKIVKDSTNKNIIFVLVATPVEEVGRDHDFDWAIIEPSSFRSFIQMAGRVLRHRDIYPDKPNIGIMQYNYKTLENNGVEVVFNNPGYQKNQDDLSSYNLNKILNINELFKKLDATNRIQDSNFCEFSNLEHKVIAKLLTSDIFGPETLKGWLESAWWLSAMPQKYVKFRESLGEITLFLISDINIGFVEKDKWGGYEPKNKYYAIKYDDFSAFDRLWITRDYEQLLKQAQLDFNKDDLTKTALIFGEINIATYGKDLNGIIYNDQLGFIRK
jgi:CRISPR-associated endonuclease/helicase Cas3